MKLTTKLIAILLLLVNVPSVFADDPLATIESLASKDLLAVAYVDAKSVDVEACLDWATQQEFVPAEAASEMNHMTGMAQELLRQATKAGADHVITLVHQQDLMMQGPPLIVISIAEGHEPEKTIRSLRRTLGLLPIPDFELEVWNNAILGGSAQQIAKAKARTPIKRPHLATAWKKFGGHDAGAMIVASPDTRRVLRELLPKFDAPFETVTGKMIADNLISLGLSLDLPKDVGAEIVIQSTDERAAAAFHSAMIKLKELLVASDGEYRALVPPAGLAAINAVEPELVGRDVVMDLGPLLSDKTKLMELLAPARKSAQQTHRSNDLRQIILAMHNYESAYKSFPAYANFDEDGKPLLSWRVHVLPFLEQGALYKQFKLDEPWDSPHNIKLVEKMPVCFADPSMGLADLNKAGKTRYLVPRTEGTMFHKVEGITFGDITDGSSNTIAIVSVKPAKAVIWTKPVDWEVDLENPAVDLIGDGNAAVVARADGSTFTIESDMKTEKLKALLTVSGGETP